MGIGELDVLAGDAGELLGNVEGLREEALNFAGAGDDELVFFAQFIDAENGDDVLKILVALQHAFDGLRGVVMIVANDARDRECGSWRARGSTGRVDAESLSAMLR